MISCLPRRLASLNRHPGFDPKVLAHHLPDYVEKVTVRVAEIKTCLRRAPSRATDDFHATFRIEESFDKLEPSPVRVDYINKPRDERVICPN